MRTKFFILTTIVTILTANLFPTTALAAEPELQPKVRIACDGSFSDEKFINDMENVLTKLPAKIYLALYDYDFPITATTNAARYAGMKLKKGQTLMGFVETGIYGTPEYMYIQYDKDQNHSILHEIGHFVDYTWDRNSGCISLTGETWNAIYNEEKSKFHTFRKQDDWYMTSDAREYFGESFNLYCLAPEKLKANCPKTYSYIEQIIETY